jgi:hypothetical protein
MRGNRAYCASSEPRRPHSGPRILGRTLGSMANLAQRLDPREARDRDRRASQGLQALLELEEPRPRWSTTDRLADPGAHPSNRWREPDVGSASHPRRVAEARLRRRTSLGVADHAASAKAAIAELAYVSAEPHQGLRPSSACNGNRADPHRAALPMAESVLRARDRDPSAGLPRPRHRGRRAAPAAHPAEVPRVLSQLPDPPRARQGRPRTTQGRVHRCREGRRPPDGRRA